MSNANNSENNKKEILKFMYPVSPMKNNSLKNIKLYTNLMQLNLTISKNEEKLCIYSVSIDPELDKNNYSLYSKIQRQIDPDLNKIFKRKYFSGYNLFGNTNNKEELIQIEAIVENKKYTILFKLVCFFDISSIENFNGENQMKKSFLERMIKDILLKNKNTIKFGDSRTIVQLNKKNISDFVQENINNETIFKGYFTSAQITENGLFLLVENVSKYVTQITVYEKIQELRSQNASLKESEIKNIIENYFNSHKTVLTTYGSLKTYRIDYIDFDKSPKKACFNILDCEKMRTITVFDYYKVQYNVIIKDADQPLVIAESKSKRKLEKINDKTENININVKEEKAIYLVPELLYITQNPMEANNINKRALIKKTRMGPNEKMNEIFKINELISSTSCKTYKTKDGKTLPSKSPYEVSKEWGISLGDNLSIQGRLLNPPTLLYGRSQKIIPTNGRFKSGVILKGATLNRDNFIYIYDKRETSNIRNFLKILISKAKKKDLNIKVEADDMKGICLKNCTKWIDLYHDLIKNKFEGIKMAILFLSPQLEKFYNNLKDFFTNDVKIATQFVISKKLQDPKKVETIMFNVVEQINIKIGGSNFYINFFGENILLKDKIYIILGLESRPSSKNIDYIMTSSKNKNFNKIITSVYTAKNNKEEKEKALTYLMNSALNELKDGTSQYSPNYIILYRQGGNYIQNKKIAEEEVPVFINLLKNKYKKYQPKFIYVCCNLKNNLKFFEKSEDMYTNPKSGLCIDTSVTQKDKYEFYIQPQFVNLGTATPTHYEILYEDTENELKIEQLEQLSYYLSYYYWTWPGAVRVPGALKLATTAMDFFTKHLGGRLEKDDKKFINPEYI